MILLLGVCIPNRSHWKGANIWERLYLLHFFKILSLMQHLYFVASSKFLWFYSRFNPMNHQVGSIIFLCTPFDIKHTTVDQVYNRSNRHNEHFLCLSVLRLKTAKSFDYNNCKNNSNDLTIFSSTKYAWCLFVCLSVRVLADYLN